MNRLEWALGILLVILLIGVIVLSVIFWFQPDPYQPPAVNTSATAVAARANKIAPTSVYQGQTAKVGFASARQAASGWQADAQLVGASAAWPQGTDRHTLLTGETTWNFTFYSPAKGVNGIFSVTDNEAALLSEAPAENAAISDITLWEQDSKDVLASFLNAGGDEFLQRESITTLNMVLASREQDGRLEWLLLLFAPASGSSLTMKIDATSGEIIQNNTTGS